MKFGMWTATIDGSERANTKVPCICNCGTQRHVRLLNLTQGRSASCGCSAYRTKHGLSCNRSYRSWVSMMTRCNNPTNKQFKDYGGRGIKVCERWMNDCSNFISDMGEREPGMTLDRIDNDGNYEPGNCRWATLTQQARNRRTTRYVTVNGITKCVKEWSEVLGLNYQTVLSRVRVGTPLSKTFK